MPNSINKKKSVPTHRIKLQNNKDRKKILKATRKKR